MADLVGLQISGSLESKLSDRCSKTRFDNRSEYAEFVLEEVLHQMNSIEQELKKGVDTDDVEDRLKSLGYLDN